MIQAVPTAGQLPSGWTDGYWVGGGTVHILTRHLSLFALTGDTEAPTPPVNPPPRSTTASCAFYSAPGTDDSGAIANFVFFIDGKPVRTSAARRPSSRSARTTRRLAHVLDRRARRAGNPSPPRDGRGSASIAGLSLEPPRGAPARRFTVGDITVADSSAARRHRRQPAGLTLAGPAPPSPLQLAGGIELQTKLGFGLIGTGRLPLAQRKFIGVRFASNDPSTFTVTLLTKKHKALKTWHFQFHAGIGIRKLTCRRRRATPAGTRCAGRRCRVATSSTAPSGSRS